MQAWRTIHEGGQTCLLWLAIIVAGWLVGLRPLWGEEPWNPPTIMPPTFKAATYRVKDFGALGDGMTNDTPAINRAIEACHAGGGGDVVFTEGKYLAASIHLRSNLRLVVEPKAVIAGAAGGFDPPEPNPNDLYQDFGHSHFHNALMWGEQIENFAIVGGGRINGGKIGEFDPKEPGSGDKVIALVSSKNILVDGITHENGGHFVYLLNDCENVTLKNVVIKRSRDGVDLMGCRQVQISGCTFTGCIDDTLGIKSDWALGRKLDSRGIYAWDCTFGSGCNGLQFGSETAGDFTDIHFRRIRITKALKAGIGITTNDGGIIDGVTYSEISISGAAVPIFMLITDRLRSGDPGKHIGAIRNVRISDVTVTDCQPGIHGAVQPITISGRPEAPLKNITLERVRVTYPGAGKREWSDLTPPYRKEYAPKALGDLPAAGLFVRHVHGLTVRDVSFSFLAPDQRPGIVGTDLTDLILDGFQAPKVEGIDRLRLQSVRNVTVSRSSGLTDRTGSGLDRWVE